MLSFKFCVLIILSIFLFVYIHSEGVGSQCFDESDCGLWHFDCINEICFCDKDHIPDAANKWCAVDILQPCGYHDTCFDPNADCYDVAIPKYGSCQCNPGYTLNMQKRVCSVVIGNNCSTTNDCIEGKCSLALPCVDGACNYTQCFCNDPLQPNINGTKCLPALDDNCADFNECAKENAICTSTTKICECDEFFKVAERDEDVFCLAMLDNTCKNVTDCADIGADCVKNKTETSSKSSRDTYWPDYPPTEPPPIKYCVCGEGYVRHPNISECLIVATNLHDNCTNNIQCTTFSGFGSECVNEHCECKKGFYFDIDFKRCVRSCLCDEMDSDIKEIKHILKELSPTFQILAKTYNLDISKTLEKIHNFS